MPADWTMRDVLRDQDGLVHADSGEPRRQPRRASDRLDRRLPLRARRSRGGDRAAGRADHPDHLADHHRGRLPRPRRARVRSDHRGPGPASRPRHRRTDDRVVRQHREQRRGRAAGRRSRTPNAAIPGSAEWVAEHTRFPSSMVDRITPATTLEMAAEVQRDFGVDDRVAGGGRAVHRVGARGRLRRRQAAAGRRRACCWSTMSRPYESMKLRLLNAGHQCLCYFAHLCGYRVGARRGARSVVRRIPARLFRLRGHPDAAAGARHRPA